MSNVAAVGRHVRALRLLTCLQTGEEFNTKELADRLKVSRRTIFRDLKLLREAGIHAFYDEAKGTFRLPNPLPESSLGTLTEDDLCELIFAARLSIVHAIPELGQSLATTLQRLIAKCPSTTRTRVEGLVQNCRLRIDAAKVGVPRPASLSVVRAIQTAMRRDNPIRIAYKSEQEASHEYVLDRCHLEVTATHWYLIGTLADGRSQTFDIQRVMWVESATRNRTPAA